MTQITIQIHHRGTEAQRTYSIFFSLGVSMPLWWTFLPSIIEDSLSCSATNRRTNCVREDTLGTRPENLRTPQGKAEADRSVGAASLSLPLRIHAHHPADSR